MPKFQPIQISKEAFIELQKAYLRHGPALMDSNEGKLPKKHEFYTKVIETGIKAMEEGYGSHCSD